MKYVIIENNKIVNMAVSDEALESNWILLEGDFGIGDEYIDGKFIKFIPPIEVPQILTPRQARLVLLEEELLDELEALIANDRVLQIWWEYSLEIKRNDERLLQAAVALKLTDEQLDNMFIRAVNL